MQTQTQKRINKLLKGIIPSWSELSSLSRGLSERSNSVSVQVLPNIVKGLKSFDDEEKQTTKKTLKTATQGILSALEDLVVGAEMVEAAKVILVCYAYKPEWIDNDNLDPFMDVIELKALFRS